MLVEAVEAPAPMYVMTFRQIALIVVLVTRLVTQVLSALRVPVRPVLRAKPFAQLPAPIYKPAPITVVLAVPNVPLVIRVVPELAKTFKLTLPTVEPAATLVPVVRSVSTVLVVVKPVKPNVPAVSAKTFKRIHKTVERVVAHAPMALLVSKGPVWM